MTLACFQEALALLIRQPEAHRGPDLDAVLAGRDLDPFECRRLRTLARDPRVQKFGRSMAGVRWQIVEHKLTVIPRFVEMDVLEPLFFEAFDPGAPGVRADDLAVAFVDFLLRDSGARAALCCGDRAWIEDVLRFEHGQLSFWRKLRDGAPPPGGRRLRHGQFETVALEHDVAEVVLAPPSELDATLAPDLRPVIVLMSAGPGGTSYFEIDESIDCFLRREIDERSEPERTPPDGYERLVELGLCFPLEPGGGQAWNS